MVLDDDVMTATDNAATAAGAHTDGDDSYVMAALGNTWSHCVNTRLIVQYADDNCSGAPGSARQVRETL